MLAVTDRPRHRELRNLMLRAFSPRVLGAVEQKIWERTSRLIKTVTGQGAFDFAAEVAERIPMNTICDLLSIPEADREKLLRWNKLALSSHDAESDRLDSLEARNEIIGYFMDLARHRRGDPGDDVVSMIATAEVRKPPLTLEEVALNCYSLVLGGDESSRVSAICAVKTFAEHPAQWRALREGSAAIDTAVEEVLRWATPAMHSAGTSDPGHGDRRPAGARGRHRDAVEHLRQQRRGGVRPAAPLDPGPLAQQAPLLRPRPALLRRRVPRPDELRRTAERARRVGQRDRGVRQAHTDLLHLPERLRQPAGRLPLTAVSRTTGSRRPRPARRSSPPPARSGSTARPRTAPGSGRPAWITCTECPPSWKKLSESLASRTPRMSRTIAQTTAAQPSASAASGARAPSGNPSAPASGCGRAPRSILPLASIGDSLSTVTVRAPCARAATRRHGHAGHPAQPAPWW